MTDGPGARGPEPQVIVVTAAGGDIRRAVGPVAWLVLEELALARAYTDDGWVARLSARILARRLGVDKDTAARALRRLAAVGVIDHLGQDHASGGRFAAGSYRLFLPDGLSTAPGPAIGGTARSLVDGLSGSPCPAEADTVAELDVRPSGSDSKQGPMSSDTSTELACPHSGDTDPGGSGPTPREPQRNGAAPGAASSARRGKRRRQVAENQESLFDFTSTAHGSRHDDSHSRHGGGR